MKTGRCKCGNRVFFSNFHCLACGLDLGRCDHCIALTSFEKAGNGVSLCTACKQPSYPCNHRSSSACNSFVKKINTLCQWCKFTTVTPDLAKPENLQRWAELERAKRRLLLELWELKLPPYIANLSVSHPLSFQFLENHVDEQGAVKPVYTGHTAGVITINILEADSVHREQTRVALGEPQRTLIGHMRHEVGHYIDWAYASRVARQDYVKLFGDPDSKDYELAKNSHYTGGPPPHWPDAYVSAYAAMHPWEDFAETVNAYLDLMAIGNTANDQRLASIDVTPQASAEKLVNSVLKIAVTVSEFNLDLGLLPLLPERLSPVVLKKLAFVHNLRSSVMIEKVTQLATAGR